MVARTSRRWGAPILGAVLLVSISDLSVSAAPERPFSVASKVRVSGLGHPESVAYDPGDRTLLVSRFGSVLRPTLKDGKGKISRVSLTGRLLEERFLPGPGDILHKPKGIWVEGRRAWVADIDTAWVFDLTNRKGRKVLLPGARFANDVALMDGSLFVSDTATGKIYRVSPADFLSIAGHPEVSVFASGLSFGPNGLCPTPGGTLLVAGYDMGGRDRGIYEVDGRGSVRVLAEGLGRLDGIARLSTGLLILTDWKSGSLLLWDEHSGHRALASGLRGPADFCLVPRERGLTVVVPDLVTGDLYIIGLAR